MTKEELEKEAEEKYCKGCKLRMEQCLWAWRKTNGLNEPNEKNCSCKKVPAYIAGAEPREKRIEELIALINAERERQEKCDDVHLRKIAELEKENAELKEEFKKWKDGIALKDEEIGCIETEFNTFKSKAKEIIKTFLGFAETFGYSPSMDRFITDAEQFLSEVEK